MLQCKGEEGQKGEASVHSVVANYYRQRISTEEKGIHVAGIKAPSSRMQLDHRDLARSRIHRTKAHKLKINVKVCQR